MENQQSQFHALKKYINLLLSRRKMIAGFVLLAVSAGLLIYLSMGKIYESSASLVYQEQRINPTRDSRNEAENMRDMVTTLAQQVMSRDNIEAMIDEFGLYPEASGVDDRKGLVGKARDNIGIIMEPDKGNVFTVSFQGRDPATVQQVTNWLASRFIEENLQIRAERARETSEYVQEELQMAKARLERKEEEMKEYKLEHYNEMPDQRRDNINRLEALQRQFQDIQTNIYNLEQTRLLLAEQLESRRNLLAQEEATVNGQLGTPAQKLSAARNRLQDLLVRYTPQHPEVKRQKQRIRQIEAGIESARQQQQSLEETGNAQNPDTGSTYSGDERIQQLSAQISEIEVNLRTLRKESNKILEKIKKYEQYVEAAPVREAEWASLTRDYEELKQYHDQLLSQSLSAEAAETLEIRQKGSQFKILDPAFLPENPIRGTFLKILLASVVIGLAAGAGSVLGIDFINTSFKEAAEVESYLQLPVTCALPLIVTETEQKRAKISNIAWSTVLSAWLIALIAAGTYLWLQGELII